MNKKTIINIGLQVYAAFLVVIHCSAQNTNTIQKAMKDELDRNMKELVLQGHEKPFFIQYGINDEKSVFVSASLGSILHSSEIPSRTKTSVRILVGDYGFNDESLDNNIYSQPGAAEISLPIDDYYDGIRRSFWVTTDQVYKGAAKKFKKNQEMLKEQEKLLDEVPHRRFAKVPVSNINVANNLIDVKRKEIEDYVRTLSAVFKNYNLVKSSSVFFFFTQGHRYLVNSEGSVNKVPYSLASLMITIQIKTEKDVLLFNQIEKYARTPGQLPPVESMKQEIERQVASMEETSKAPSFTEEYSGPILFIGPSVADLFKEKILASQDRLFAQNNIPALKGYQYEQSTTLESKIGKSLFADGLTIKAQPKLKTLKGVDLLGSFDVDDEGVVPADEVVLVENGILKNLMNDRTLTTNDQVANGLGAGPGVISVSFKTGNSVQELKNKLIAQAKKEGLDYALIIKDQGFGRPGLTNVYKVFVATGKEELCRSAQVKTITLKDFKKIGGVSSEMAVYHSRGNGSRANMISFIVPDALLLDEVEVGESRVPVLHEEEYVSSPLKK